MVYPGCYRKSVSAPATGLQQASALRIRPAPSSASQRSRPRTELGPCILDHKPSSLWLLAERGTEPAEVLGLPRWPPTSGCNLPSSFRAAVPGLTEFTGCSHDVRELHRNRRSQHYGAVRPFHRGGDISVQPGRISFAVRSRAGIDPRLSAALWFWSLRTRQPFRRACLGHLPSLRRVIHALETIVDQAACFLVVQHVPGLAGRAKGEAGD